MWSLKWQEVFQAAKHSMLYVLALVAFCVWVIFTGVISASTIRFKDHPPSDHKVYCENSISRRPEVARMLE